MPNGDSPFAGTGASQGGTAPSPFLEEGQIMSDSRPQEAMFNPGRTQLSPFVDREESFSEVDDGTPQLPAMPPFEGPGSGVRSWREYAVAINVDFDAKASKDEIIAAVKASESFSEVDDGSDAEEHDEDTDSIEE